MPNAAPRRPVMWRALMRETGEAMDASTMAASSATHGNVSGVRHSGSRREATTTTAHAANAASTAASRLLTDCRGRRTSGSVSSNGAASVSNATPANSGERSMGSAGPMHKARLLHRHAAHPDSRRKRAASLTVDERSFQNPKLGAALLFAYKVAADLAGKASVFVVTIVAARLLSTEAFGIFSLATTLGWLVAVVTDSGMQLHIARAIARRPDHAAPLLRAWMRVRLSTAAAAVVIVAIAAAAGGWSS